jgi:hypothetical protein
LVLLTSFADLESQQWTATFTAVLHLSCCRCCFIAAALQVVDLVLLSSFADLESQQWTATFTAVLHLSCCCCCFIAAVLQVVDLVLLNSFADFDESAVDSVPLLLLPCGHVFTTSTLDGWMDMAAAYEGAAPGACYCFTLHHDIQCSVRCMKLPVPPTTCKSCRLVLMPLQMLPAMSPQQKHCQAAASPAGLPPRCCHLTCGPPRGALLGAAVGWSWG